MKTSYILFKLFCTSGILFSSLAQAYEINVKTLGNLELGGALTGYYLSGKKVARENKKSRVDIASAIITLNKKVEPLGFTIQSGIYSLPTVGIDHTKSTDYTDLFSPLPIAYFEFSLLKNLTITTGRIGTLIGYESPFTFQNNYLQRGLVWNMQPLFHHGLRVSYKIRSPLTLKFGINDGYYSLGVDSYSLSKKTTKKVDPAFEFSSSFILSENLNISLNLLLPKRDALPNEVANPTNKRQYNMVLSHTRGNLTFAIDSLWVEAPKSIKAQVSEKTRAYGLALHLGVEHLFYKIATRFEYVKDKKDKGKVDLIGLGDGNRAYIFTFTPGYYRDPLFLRLELSYIKAEKNFTYNKRDEQIRYGLEMGLKF